MSSLSKNFARLLPNWKLFVMVLLLALQACDNDPAPVVPVGADGFFVVNEGAFNGSNTSISFYDRNSDAMTNDVFAKRNGRPLGDQAQSITVFEGKAYVIVQHSAKIEVIDADTYASLKTITGGIESPRYFVAVSSTKGYVSDWGADGVTGTVKVVDLATLEVIKSISTGQGPNRMLVRGNDLYVANSGGWGKDNKVSIIDIAKDEVRATIQVGDNPNSLQFDKDGNLWVASAGALAYNEDYSIDVPNSTKSTLSKIVGSSETKRFTFPRVTYGGLSQLESSPAGDRLYYNYDNAVYSIASSAAELPATPLINKDFYGISVDPFTGNVIGCEAINFSSPGKIYLYTAEGSLLREMEVGIAPNGVGYK